MRMLALLLSLSLLPSALYAGQSEISARMKTLASALVTSHRAKHPAAEKERIAVFEFNSTKELRERRVGHAVAELLTHHINGDSGFVLVERLELNKIMEELKLSMAGVTDQEDALKAGKLGGARVVVLGSVEKFGDKYHVNARLVDVETGEVAATAYEAMPVRVFEEEAKGYMVLAPEVQRIGFYALFNWRHNPNNVPTNSGSGPSAWVQGGNSPDPFDIGLIGLGVRYCPFRRWVVDVAYMANSTLPRAGQRTQNYGASNETMNEAYRIGAKAFRGLIGYRVNFFPNSAVYFSAGATNYKMVNHTGTNYVTPTTQIRLEFFPQQRLGISLTGNCDLVNKIATGYYRDEQRTADLARLSQFSVESSVSVYF